MYELIEKTHIKYFTNSNKTILYLYNRKTHSIKKVMRSEFSTTKLLVLEVKKNIQREIDIDLQTIIDGENNFIIPVEIISSTVKDKGFFIEEDENGLKSYFLNEFLNSETFVNSKLENKYQNQDIIQLLENKTPTINLLIKNLFHNEKDEMIINFINWLNVVSFQDRHQDIMYLFMGTNEKNQGQGAGKGVFQKLLNKIFSGLVCSVSGNFYLRNFNSMLLNKKVIVFDEINFNSLKYEHIKDITGSPCITIEFKGKEPFVSKNVSSWLWFSNEWDLCNKITIEDRRLFLIRPNPVNGSLKRIIDKNFNGNFEYFENELYDEIEEFIHIISNVDGKVKSPLELKSKGHIDYFKEQRKVSILDINNLYKTFIDKNFKDKLFKVLDTIKDLDKAFEKSISDYKRIINLNTINYKTFKEIFQLLQNYGYIPKQSKCNVEWELLEENLYNHNFILNPIDIKQNKTYKRYKDLKVLINIDIKNNRNQKTRINQKYREVFGTKLN